jgi:hypothetical protein
MTHVDRKEDGDLYEVIRTSSPIERKSERGIARHAGQETAIQCGVHVHTGSLPLERHIVREADVE